MSITYTLSVLFYFYGIILFLRIFLTWIPNIDWSVQPCAFLRAISDPYLDIFRRFIPPINGIDFSPILAVFLLSFIGKIVIYFLLFLGIN